MKHLLLASILITSNSVYCMDNPHPDTQPDANDELHSSLSNSSADEQDHEQDNTDQDINNDLRLPLFIYASTKEQRKQYKQEDNAELMRLARQMLAHGGNLNCPLNHARWTSNTLLTVAAKHKCHKNVLDFALQNGANPNAPDRQGNTPLQVATKAYCAQNVTLLLAHGARPDNRLIGALCNPFVEKIKSTRISTLQAILNAGVDPNQAVLGSVSAIKYVPCIMSILLLQPQTRLSDDAYDDFLAHRKFMISHLLNARLNLFKEDANGKTDWQKIQECNYTYKKYDPQLFDFLQGQLSSKSRDYRFELQA